VDGRADLYGDDWLNHYESILTASPDYEQNLDTEGINLVVTLPMPYAPLAAVLQENPLWRSTYNDGQTVIYERITPLP